MAIAHRVVSSVLTALALTLAGSCLARPLPWTEAAPEGVRTVCLGKGDAEARTACFSDARMRFVRLNIPADGSEPMGFEQAGLVCQALASADRDRCLDIYRRRFAVPAVDPARSAQGSAAVPSDLSSAALLRGMLNQQIADKRQQERIRELQRQQDELHRQQLAAEQEAADAVRREQEDRDREEEARARAARPNDDESLNFVVGLAAGAVLSKATGSADTGRQMASAAGFDATGASLGAGMVAQQQQANEQIAQIKAQEQALESKIAAEQQAQRAAQAARAAQVAAQRSQQAAAPAYAQAAPAQPTVPPPRLYAQAGGRAPAAVPARANVSTLNLYAGDAPNGNENPIACISTSAGSEGVAFTNICQSTNVEVDVCGTRSRGPHEYGMASLSTHGPLTLYHQGLTGNSGYWQFRSDGADPDTTYTYAFRACRVAPGFLQGAENCPASCPAAPQTQQAAPAEENPGAPGQQPAEPVPQGNGQASGGGPVEQQ